MVQEQYKKLLLIYDCWIDLREKNNISPFSEAIEMNLKLDGVIMIMMRYLNYKPITAMQ
jgi:hypothetical protein